MFIKKFEAASLEQALSLVKGELGPNALVLSTQTKRGKWFNKEVVEVVAAFERGREGEVASGLDEKELTRIFPHRKLIPAEEAASERPKKTQRYDHSDTSGRRSYRFERELERYGVGERSRQEFLRRLPFEFPKEQIKDTIGLDRALARLGSESLRTLTFDGFVSKGSWLVLGTAGSGKTSFVVKCALHAKKAGHSVLLSSLDRRKVFAERELGTYAKLVGVPFSSEAGARSLGTLSIVDSPSLELTEEGVDEISRVVAKRNPLLVLDATARASELIRVAQRVGERVKITAVTFTKVDLVASRGAIYDFLKETKLPCFCLSQSQSFKTELQFLEPLELASSIFRS